MGEKQIREATGSPVSKAQKTECVYEVRLIVHANHEWTDDQERQLGDAVDGSVRHIKDALPWGPHPAFAAAIEVQGPQRKLLEAARWTPEQGLCALKYGICRECHAPLNISRNCPSGHLGSLRDDAEDARRERDDALQGEALARENLAAERQTNEEHERTLNELAQVEHALDRVHLALSEYNVPRAPAIDGVLYSEAERARLLGERAAKAEATLVAIQAKLEANSGILDPLSFISEIDHDIAQALRACACTAHEYCSADDCHGAA